jgi:hypothetical protein
MSILSITIEGGQTMPMKNPHHPGEMIGDEIEALGVSISHAAKAIGGSGLRTKAPTSEWVKL